MKYLWAQWDKLEKHIADKFVLLFLDYDGTLAPIVKNPDKALIYELTRNLLKKLSACPACKLAIVTGRSAKDIKVKIGIRNIIYASNHGLQIKGPGINFIAPLPADFRKLLWKIKKDLEKTLHSVKGIFLEDKGASFSVHYRRVRTGRIAFVTWAVLKIALPSVRKKKMVIALGKKVLEIRPPVEWNKGSVVLWLLNKYKSTLCDKSIIPIYIGDDTTDEDAFKALMNEGLTIFVGRPKKSHAKYYLKNTREVSKFLKCLNVLLS
jgi:trehalose-phosphatase